MSEQAELRDLYQEVILDHGRRPRNYRRLDQPTHQARGDNPMCGDRVELFLRVTEGSIAEATFLGRGCAISQAAASLLTETTMGLAVDRARALSTAFRAFARSGACPDCDPGLSAPLDRLAPLTGVHEFPSRVKCATLAWHALDAALAGSKEASSE